MEIHVETRPGAGGHRDLFLAIPQLGLVTCADTYYFALALEERHVKVHEVAVRQAVSALLSYWIDWVLSCADGDTIHLPFDFSDQYTGCLQVKAEGSNVWLSYGYSLIEGWRVDPLEPGTYFQQVEDFKADPDQNLKISRIEFLDAVRGAFLKIDS